MLRLTAATIIAVFALGCGSTARVKLHGSSLVEGRIVRGTDDAVIVEHDDTEFEIPRASIDRIHHPGTDAAIGGLLAAGTGVSIAAYGIISAAVDGGGSWAYVWAMQHIMIGTPPFVVGGVVSLVGLNSYVPSKRRAARSAAVSLTVAGPGIAVVW